MTRADPPTDPGPPALADDGAWADRLFGGAVALGIAAYLPLLFASFAWDDVEAEGAFRAALAARYPDPEAAEPLGLLLLLRGETGEGCALLGAAPRPLSARGEALLARCASAP